MLVLAMLLWVGLTLSAPSWYWWCWGINVAIGFIKFAFNMYKAGRDN